MLEYTRQIIAINGLQGDSTFCFDSISDVQLCLRAINWQIKQRINVIRSNDGSIEPDELRYHILSPWQ